MPPDDRARDRSLLGGVSRAARRSMTWPLEALLVELAGGAGRAFRGRRVGMKVNGRQVRANLESIWLEPKAGRYAGRIELRSVDYDGFEIETLSVFAEDVTVMMAPDAALVMSGVELRGRAALEPLVAWLDTTLTEWSVSLAEGRLIEAVRPGGGRGYIVHAAIRDGEAEVELRAVRLRRIILPCPRWPRLTRKLTLPPLPGGGAVTEARHVEAGVEFRLSLPSLRQKFDPGRVRLAIRLRGSSGSDGPP